MKIGMKLVLSFTIILIMSSIVTFYNQYQLNNIQENMDAIVHEIYPQVIAAHDLKIEINYLARPIRNAIIYTTQEEYDKQADRLKKSKAKMQIAIDTLKLHMTDPQGLDALKKLESALTDFHAANQKTFDLAVSGQKAEATVILNTDIRDASEKLLKVIENLIKDENKQIGNKMEDGDEHIGNSIKYGLILFLIILICSIFLAWVMIKGVTKPIKIALDAAINVAKGNMNVKLDLKRKDEFGDLFKAFNTMKDNINSVISVVSDITNHTLEGKLDFRANSSQFDGAYKSLVEGVNQTVDTIVSPLNMTAEYIDRISKGEIPHKINTEYHGDFNEIKNNINSLIDNLNNFINEMNGMAKAHKLGDIDAKVDLSEFSGVYFEMANGLNDSVHLHVANQLKILDILKEYSEGNLVPELEKLPGKQEQANVILNLIRTNLNNIITELNTLISAAGKGDLSKRGNALKFKGAYSDIITGFNKMMESTEQPIREIQSVLVNISSFDLTSKVTSDYSGIWNDLKLTTNKVISDLNDIQELALEVSNGNMSKLDFLKKLTITKNNKLVPAFIAMMESVNLMIEDVKLLSESAINGDLTYRIDSTHHKGEYQYLVNGVNETINELLSPINEAQAVLQELASGNLTVLMQGNYHGDHQSLKISINTLVASLNNLLLRTQEVTETLVSNASHIYKSTERMARTAEQQANQVTEVAAAIEELTKTITVNAQGASQTASAANNNGKIAVQGGTVVQETIDKMTIIAKTVNESAQKIGELGESSLKISEIISVIDDIADQTNLLALNAAIEAARAGEQGRGFAVVADEVRKLAERTTLATKEIASMIKGIQSDTQIAVEVMKQGNSQVNDGIKFADQAGLSLKDIVSSSKEVLDMISHIASATEEQSATSEEIAKVVDSISYGINNTTENIQEIENYSEELNNLTILLKDLMEKFSIDASLVDIDHDATHSPHFLEKRKDRYLHN